MTVYSRQYRGKQLALPIEYVGWRSRDRLGTSRSVNQPEVKESAKAEINGLLGWNLGLALVSMALALTFVFLANYLVSQKYSLEVLRQRLGKANIELELESAAIEEQYSVESLLSFAKSRGLIEAKEADSIQGLEDSALTQGNN